MGRLLLLLGLTALVFYALTQLPQQPQSIQPQAGLLLPQLAQKLDQVERIRIQTVQTQFQLQKQGQIWHLLEKAAYPVEREKIVALLTTLAELQTGEAKTADPQRHAQLDLQDPAQGGKALKLSLETAQGQVLASLLLGKSQPDKSDPHLQAVYVRQADVAQTWRVVGALNVATDPLAWVTRSLLALDTRRVRELTLTPADGAVVRIQRASPETQEYHLADLPPGGALKTASALSVLVFQAANLTLDDILAPPAEFKVDGRYELTTFDGLQVVAEWAAAGENWLLRLKAAAVAPMLTGEPQRPFLKAEEVQQTVAEVNARWGQWVYQMPAMTHAAIFKSLADLASVPPEQPVTPALEMVSPASVAVSEAIPAVGVDTTTAAPLPAVDMTLPANDVRPVELEQAPGVDRAILQPTVSPETMPLLPTPAVLPEPVSVQVSAPEASTVSALLEGPAPVEPASASVTPAAVQPAAMEPGSAAILDSTPAAPVTMPASVSPL